MSQLFSGKDREGGFRYRISLLYQKSLFFTPSVLETRRVHRSLFCAPRVYSVPQEALSGTECHKHNAVTSCGANYRVINTLITAMPSLRTSASLRTSPHYGHPPHGSRLGQETTALRENLCNFLKKLRELSRSFFIFVPNKYRNTQCKLFTTNTTNSWNLPR